MDWNEVRKRERGGEQRAVLCTVLVGRGRATGEEGQQQGGGEAGGKAAMGAASGAGADRKAE